MRKVLALLLAIVIIGSLSIPTFAAESGFVPSITYKPDPEIVPVEDKEGRESIGVIHDENGEIIDYVDHGCLMITPIAYVWDEEKTVPKDVERLLTFVYEELNSDNMEIPYDKHDAELDSSNMVIRDLIDIRWVCEEHHAMVEKEGVFFEITFDLGVVADAQIFAMTYDEDADEWSPVVNVVNNGDGTVTCTFEHLCAVEFSMPLAATTVPTDEVPCVNIMLWIIVLILATVAMVIILMARNKKKTVV